MTATPPSAPKRPSAEPYTSELLPLVGGEVKISVSAWGYWNAWIDVWSYVDLMGHADTPLQPGECISLARRLIVAAVVCWWKRLPDQLRGRLASVRKIRKGRR